MVLCETTFPILLPILQFPIKGILRFCGFPNILRKNPVSVENYIGHVQLSYYKHCYLIRQAYLYILCHTDWMINTS